MDVMGMEDLAADADHETREAEAQLADYVSTALATAQSAQKCVEEIKRKLEESLENVSQALRKCLDSHDDMRRRLARLESTAATSNSIMLKGPGSVIATKEELRNLEIKMHELENALSQSMDLLFPGSDKDSQPSTSPRKHNITNHPLDPAVYRVKLRSRTSVAQATNSSGSSPSRSAIECVAPSQANNEQISPQFENYPKSSTVSQDSDLLRNTASNSISLPDFPTKTKNYRNNLFEEMPLKATLDLSKPSTNKTNFSRNSTLAPKLNNCTQAVEAQVLNISPSAPVNGTGGEISISVVAKISSNTSQIPNASNTAKPGKTRKTHRTESDVISLRALPSTELISSSTKEQNNVPYNKVNSKNLGSASDLSLYGEYVRENFLTNVPSMPLISVPPPNSHPESKHVFTSNTKTQSKDNIDSLHDMTESKQQTSSPLPLLTGKRPVAAPRTQLKRTDSECISQPQTNYQENEYANIPSIQYPKHISRSLTSEQSSENTLKEAAPVLQQRKTHYKPPFVSPVSTQTPHISNENDQHKSFQDTNTDPTSQIHHISQDNYHHEPLHTGKNNSSKETLSVGKSDISKYSVPPDPEIRLPMKSIVSSQASLPQQSLPTQIYLPEETYLLQELLSAKQRVSQLNSPLDRPRQIPPLTSSCQQPMAQQMSSFDIISQPPTPITPHDSSTSETTIPHQISSSTPPSSSIKSTYTLQISDIDSRDTPTEAAPSLPTSLPPTDSTPLPLPDRPHFSKHSKDSIYGCSNGHLSPHATEIVTTRTQHRDEPRYVMGPGTPKSTVVLHEEAHEYLYNDVEYNDPDDSIHAEETVQDAPPLPPRFSIPTDPATASSTVTAHNLTNGTEQEKNRTGILALLRAAANVVTVSALKGDVATPKRSRNASTGQNPATYSYSLDVSTSETDTPPTDPASALIRAAKEGDHIAIRVLIAEHGVGIADVRDAAGDSAIHWAAYSGQAVALETLIECGSDVDANGAGGRAPLHYAAAADSARCISVLLAGGASADARSPSGATPLHLAAQWGRRDATDALLAAGADPRARDSQGRTPAHLATDKDIHELLERAETAAWASLVQAKGADGS